MRVEILQMKNGPDGERREMTHQHLRIGGGVNGPFTADPLKAMRHRPCEERHVQVRCDGLQQVVDPLLLHRIDRDDGMPGLDQRLEIVCGIGGRHLQGRSGCCDSMNR